MKIEKDMNTFSAKDYLNEYYTTLSDENIYLMDWYSDLYANMDISEKAKLLEVGGGPTIYQLASAAYKVKNITFTDYLEENLAEIREWADKSGDFWDKFVQYALEKEGKLINDQIIKERKDEIIRALDKIEQLDASILNSEYVGKYDIIQSNFCLESSTDDIGRYKTMLHNLSHYVVPGGVLLMSALEGAAAYKVGDKYFPAIYLDEKFATEYLNEAGFEVESIKTILADDPEHSKYRGFLFIKAKKV
jgi:ubiquinone/menaquinone biosynthesis C-methylase UbiE